MLSGHFLSSAFTKCTYQSHQLCRHVTTPELLNGFSLNLLSVGFDAIERFIRILVKTVKQRAHCVDTSMPVCASVGNDSCLPA
jgi:hypothetical protein